MSDDSNLIRAKDYVILKRADESRLFQLSKKPRIQFPSCDIDLANVVGKPYGTIFRVEKRGNKKFTLEVCDSSERTAPVLDNERSGSDNRNIHDDNNAQKLSKNEILEMKDNGVSSQDILQQLVKNSKTFSQKTEFAQEKWLRKKSTKYTDYVQILKPNIRLITEVCLDPLVTSKKLLGLRIDTLSQIITAVNIQPEGTYLIYENNCEGLVLAAILNLLNVEGKILNIITPNYPFKKLLALTAMKFAEEKRKRLVNVNLSSFFKYSKTSTPESPSAGGICLSTTDCESSNVSVDIKEEQTNNLDGNEDENLKRKLDDNDDPVRKKTTHQERGDEEVRELLHKKADGLILVCKEQPNVILQELLQFLAPSRNFVVYCQFQEPLVKLFQILKQRQDVIYIRLFENFFRPYQVLPNRTHPHISMSGTGGFILTGITVTNE